MTAFSRIRPGYKQTDMGVIPEDWDSRELRALASMKSGIGITSASLNEGSKYPCYGGNGIRGHTMRFTHEGSYALIGRQGALCGNVLRANGKFFASEHAVVVSAFAQTDIDWLALVLSEKRLNQYSESSAQPGLSVTKLLSLRVAAPTTKDEQRAIAAALGDADTLIASLDALIAKKRCLKQAAMQQLLTGKTRLPGFKDEWKVKRLGEVTCIKTGKRNNEDKVEEGAYPLFVRSQNVERISSYSYDCEAILVPGEGGIGSIIHYVNGKFDCHQRVYKINDFDAHTSGKFVFFCMRYGFHEQATRNSVKAAVDSLRLPTFQTFEFLCPALDEQSAIAAILSDMDVELTALEAKRDKARSIKQGMMQELLTGRIRLV